MSEYLNLGAQALELMGFPRRSAAYLAGNIMQESGWRSGARESASSARQFGYNPEEAGVGLVQWSFGRRRKMLDKFGGQLPDVQQQLGYMIDEMKNEYSDAYKTFMNPNATDDELKQASRRYWGYGKEGGRYQYAQQALRHLEGQGAAPLQNGRQVGAIGSLTSSAPNSAINDFSEQFQSAMQVKLAQKGLDDEFKRNERININGQEYGRAVKNGRDVLVKWGSVAGTGGGGQPVLSPSSSGRTMNQPIAQGNFATPEAGRYKIYADHWEDFSPTAPDGTFGALDYTIVDTTNNSDAIPKYNPFEGGVVTFAGPADGYGNFVAVKDDKGFEWGVGHVKDIKVKVGDRLPRGAILATQGTTGRSTGVHTHGELRFNNRLLGGKYVDEFGRAYLRDFYNIDLRR